MAWMLQKIYKKYVGVQSWKAMHLPSLDIRVKQMGNRAMKDMCTKASLVKGQVWSPFAAVW